MADIPVSNSCLVYFRHAAASWRQQLHAIPFLGVDSCILATPSLAVLLSQYNSCWYSWLVPRNTSCHFQESLPAPGSFSLLPPWSSPAYWILPHLLLPSTSFLLPSPWPARWPALAFTLAQWARVEERWGHPGYITYYLAILLSLAYAICRDSIPAIFQNNTLLSSKE